MSISSAEKLYTEEEYLALERAAEYKSEYFAGRIYAMAGANATHNLITGNVFGELRNQFKTKPCYAFTSEMRMRVSETGLYTYPDVIALCGEPHYLDEKKDNLLNPQVVVEVLSSSTEAYDRGEKFAHYRRLDSLQELLLVSQSRISVEHYVRQGKKWVLTEYRNLDDEVFLKSVDARLRVADIYERVEILPAPPMRLESG